MSYPTALVLTETTKRSVPTYSAVNRQSVHLGGDPVFSSNYRLSRTEAQQANRHALTQLIVGPLGDAWIIVRPLTISVERDASGWYVISDDDLLVYGDGATLAAAWNDYRDSLIEFCELVRGDANTDVMSAAEYSRLRQFIQPCQKD